MNKNAGLCGPVAVNSLKRVMHLTDMSVLTRDLCPEENVFFCPSPSLGTPFQSPRGSKPCVLCRFVLQ